MFRSILAQLGLALALQGPGRALAAEPAADPAVPRLKVVYPFDEAVFPPEFPPPTFRWADEHTPVTTWRIRIRIAEAPSPVEAWTRDPQWCPDAGTWQQLKQGSQATPAEVTIEGFTAATDAQPVSSARVTFSTSRDEVGAPVFYRSVNLPFADAVKDPSQIQWRFGDIARLDPPPVVLEQMPVCGNCHSFSSDGGTLGMDVDYANSKASYAIVPTGREMALKPRDIITWDDFRPEDGELTFGLLSQVSPDGNWVVSTVKDKSVFVPMPDLAFSQLFFPVKGILATYHRGTRAFAALPGADDPAFVQSNPTWSPDGRQIVFARAPAYNLSNTLGGGKVLLTPDECREFTRDGKPFRFDLYRLPFNDGRGGRPEPLAGAAGDGFSHYFPKFSPDGRWIVFCRARSYMLLQPDSELYIVPAAGGEARRMRCNLSRMNSWHSWSPNGRWLVFSSKAFSPYTQLFLTHVDADGNSTPPVLLDRFTSTNRAANIPEFVNLSPTGIVKIQEQFLNDYSYERAGNEFYRAGDTDRAIEKYRRALEFNPENSTAHQRLGFLLYHVKRQFAEGLGHTTNALRIEPRNGYAHHDLGVVLLSQGRPDEAIPHFEAALATLPASLEPQYKPAAVRANLGKACLQRSRYAEAATHLQESVRLAPENPETQYLLALALVCQGGTTNAAEHLSRAVALRPQVDTSVVLHEMLAENFARAGQFADARRAGERALELAQSEGRQEAVARLRTRLSRYPVAPTGPPKSP